MNLPTEKKVNRKIDQLYRAWKTRLSNVIGQKTQNKRKLAYVLLR